MRVTAVWCCVRYHTDITAAVPIPPCEHSRYVPGKIPLPWDFPEQNNVQHGRHTFKKDGVFGKISSSACHRRIAWCFGIPAVDNFRSEIRPTASAIVRVILARRAWLHCCCRLRWHEARPFPCEINLWQQDLVNKASGKNSISGRQSNKRYWGPARYPLRAEHACSCGHLPRNSGGGLVNGEGCSTPRATGCGQASPLPYEYKASRRSSLGSPAQKIVSRMHSHWAEACSAAATHRVRKRDLLMLSVGSVQRLVVSKAGCKTRLNCLTCVRVFFDSEGCHNLDRPCKHRSLLNTT